MDLEELRIAEIRRRLLDSLPKLRFRVLRVERNAGEEDWRGTLTAEGPSGEYVRGLEVTVLTPSPLDFERSYDWGLIAYLPIWVKYRSEVFVANVKPTLGLDDLLSG